MPPPSTRPPLPGEVLMTLVAILWGSAFPVTRVLLEEARVSASRRSFTLDNDLTGSTDGGVIHLSSTMTIHGGAFDC